MPGEVTKCPDTDKLWAMVREISAGGVVIRSVENRWQVAVIEPQKEPAAGVSAKTGKIRSQKVLLALPKGLVDPGEKPEQTAIREVKEETGITSTLITKLGDIKYVYVRTWGDKQRVFKIVSFYLLGYRSGEIDKINQEMRIEVKRALWVELEEASAKLAYRGEKEMVKKAQEYLKLNSEA
ncbi:MAG: NUDIX domain-containing protein [Acidobacteriales bacterium]|nr:NUDIX domain-containing protein [Terriglobales bacterium]